MMPDVLERIFKDFGKDINQELDLTRLDPGYHIRMQGDYEFKFTTDLKAIEKQLEKVEPGSYKKYRKYMEQSYKRYTLSMKKVVNRNYYNFFQFFNLRSLFMFIKLKAFHNHYRFTSRYFKNEFLRIVFTLQNLYLGQDPYKSPALFSILPAMELVDGVWFPKGGMYAIINSLVGIAEKNGVEFHYNKPVTSIKTNGDKVEGIQCNGDFIEADLVLSNADLPYTYKTLLADTENKLDKLNYTCSAFVFHWGIKKRYPQIEQHNVFVAKEFKKSIQHIFKPETEYVVPSTFYIHAPAINDTTAAPAGQDSYTVIVQTNNLLNDKEDWNKLKDDARKGVIKRLKEEGLTDIEEQIKFEVCYMPRSWESKFNLTNGSTFGSIAHDIFQMGYFRPKNKHKMYKNMFFAGGCTHPGNGLPLSIISGRLVAERILKKYN
jgi:phytoene desaturase